MKRFASVVAIGLVAIASTVHAGRLFGDITLGGKPVPAGIRVTITPAADKPGTAPVDTTETDKVGSYKLVAPKDGKYTLTVTRDGKSASLPVFSHAQATRYDLVLEEKEGVLGVRRK